MGNLGASFGKLGASFGKLGASFGKLGASFGNLGAKKLVTRCPTWYLLGAQSKGAQTIAAQIVTSLVAQIGLS